MGLRLTMRWVLSCVLVFSVFFLRTITPCVSAILSIETFLHRLLQLLLLLPFLCGLVRSQLDFFVNSGEEEEENTQAPFLTLDVEVQEEVGSGAKEEVVVGPNGDLHVDEVPNGDNLEGEEQGEGENAASEEPAVEESPSTVESEDGEVVNPNTEEETSTLLPVFGYIDPSELMGEQVVKYDLFGG